MDPNFPDDFSESQIFSIPQTLIPGLVAYGTNIYIVTSDVSKAVIRIDQADNVTTIASVDDLGV